MNRFQPKLAALGLLALAFPYALRASAPDDRSLRAAVSTERLRAAAPRLPRAAFVAQPSNSMVTLSPDGRYLAWRHRAGQTMQLWLKSTTGDDARALPAPAGVATMAWSHDSHWLWLQTQRQLFVVDVAHGEKSGPVLDLVGTVEREWLDVDPTQDAAVIVREHDGASWRLLRVDTQGRTSLLHKDDQRITGYALDAHGRLAWLQRAENNALVIYRVDTTGALIPTGRCEALRRCGTWPVTDADGNLLMTGDLTGDLRALLRMDAKGKVTTVLADPRGEADIDKVIADPITGRPAALTFLSVQAHQTGVDPATQRHLDALSQRWPDSDLTLQIGKNSHETWLVGERAASMQGTRWHRFDAETGATSDMLDTPPVDDRTGKPTQWLPEASLARQTHITWRASDGMLLHGFVWLPPGIDVRKAPLVTAVHGGPWNHVTASTFGHGYSQFLANRGYVVFEPNFRGSTGYGRRYMFAANGDFGNGRVQQDIVEGTRYLLANGIGDPQRTGIVGASFGGYSTLLGVTFQPELFKVGVAIVPPTDFAWDLQWIERSQEATVLSAQIPFNAMLRILGLDPDDRAAMDRLHQQSPLSNAEKVSRPLLILAGADDHRVAIRGVLGYVARLRVLGKEVKLLVDPEAGHSNDIPVATEASMYLMAETLRTVFGTPAEVAPDPVMADYITRHLR